MISGSAILDWFVQQLEGDEIEDVTAEMLNKIIAGQQGGIAALFCK